MVLKADLEESVQSTSRPDYCTKNIRGLISMTTFTVFFLPPLRFYYFGNSEEHDTLIRFPFSNEKQLTYTSSEYINKSYKQKHSVKSILF